MMTHAPMSHAPLSSVDCQNQIDETAAAIAELCAAAPELAAERRHAKLDDNTRQIETLRGRRDALLRARDDAAAREAETRACSSSRAIETLRDLRGRLIADYKALAEKATTARTRDAVLDVEAAHLRACALASDLYELTQDWKDHAMSIRPPRQLLDDVLQRMLTPRNFTGGRAPVDRRAWQELLTTARA